MQRWKQGLLLAGVSMAACGGEPPRLVVPHAFVPPVIDGVLNDAVWRQAAVIDGLRPARGGDDGARIDTVPTVVRLLWDEAFLYVAFACRDDDIHVSGNLKRDDNLYAEDVVEVFVDGFGDARQWIEIQVNPLGEVLDLMFVLASEARHGDDYVLEPAARRHLFTFREWNSQGLRHAAGRLVEQDVVVGWTVEMAIPAADLVKRTGGGCLEPMELRANFLRYDHQPEREGGARRLVHMNWAPVRHGCPHISPGAMGTLILAPAAPLMADASPSRESFDSHKAPHSR